MTRNEPTILDVMAGYRAKKTSSAIDKTTSVTFVDPLTHKILRFGILYPKIDQNLVLIRNDQGFEDGFFYIEFSELIALGC